MNSLRPRVWLGLAAAVAAGVFASNVLAGQSYATPPAPGALGASHDGLAIAVDPDTARPDGVVTVKISAPGDADYMYGGGVDLDVKTPDGWRLEYVAGIGHDGAVVTPHRLPKRRGFSTMPALVGPAEFAVRLPDLPPGTYRFRILFFSGDNRLSDVVLSATFRVDD